MLKQHKKILETFITTEIKNINMYWGYRGDYVLKLEVSEESLANAIAHYCDSLGIECKIRFEPAMSRYNVFCIAEDGDVYTLKK